MNTGVLVFGFFCFSTVCSFGQHAFTNYTISDGLPSSEVYDVLQDNNGYLWFATDRGVAKFNGQDFSIYNKQDGLVNEVVFQLYEDYKNRLWFLAQNGRLCFIENDSIKIYPYNHVLDSLLPANGPNKLFSSFYVDSMENVLIGAQQLMLQVNNDGSVKLKPEKAGVHFWNYDQQLLSYAQRSEIKENNEKFFYENTCLVTHEVKGQRSFAYQVKDHYLLFNSKNSVYVFDLYSKKLVDSINHKKSIIALNWIDHKVFVGFNLGGMKVYDFHRGTLKESYHLLQNITVSNIARDRSGGWWFTTIEHGVYYLLSSSFEYSFLLQREWDA